MHLGEPSCTLMLIGEPCYILINHGETCYISIDLDEQCYTRIYLAESYYLLMNPDVHYEIFWYHCTLMHVDELYCTLIRLAEHCYIEMHLHELF